MNEETRVRDLIHNIKTTNDKKIVHKLLFKIRTEIIKDEKGIKLFFICGGVKALLHLLNKPHEKILEVALSILGNCCIKSECAAEAYEAGIVPPLMTIILNIPNPNIQGKGCRLLGNLARTSAICQAIQGNGAANICHSILDESSDTNVLLMTIRLIRQLWNEKKFQLEIISLGCIRQIINILLKYSKNENPVNIDDEEIIDPTKVKIKTHNGFDRTVTREKFNELIRDIDTLKNTNIVSYELMSQEKKIKDERRFILPENKEILELFTGIFKCIQMITTTIISRIPEQLNGDGNGFSCLVFLSNEESPFRSLSLKVLSNLTLNISARLLLGSADVIIHATNLLKSKNLKNPLNSSEIRYCIRIICLLTGDSCSRAKIRRCGALSELVKLAKISNCEKELGMILFAFYQFRYDQLSIELLIDEGFVYVLIKLLSEQLLTMKINHIKNLPLSSSSSSKIENNDEKDVCKKISGIKKNRDLSPTSTNYPAPKYIKLDNIIDPESPASTSSGYGSSSTVYPRSPSSNISGYSPRLDINTNDFDSENYSPVCSDNDDDRDNTVDNNDQSDEIFDVFHYIPDEVFPECDESIQFPSSDTEENDNIVKDTETNLTLNIDFEKNPVQPILTLLHIATMRNKYTTDLVKPETLTTLLKLSKFIPKPLEKLSSILANILSHSKNFIPILHQNFVYDLRGSTEVPEVHENCTSCGEIKCLVEELMTLLGEVGESGYGRGEIAHFLLTGEKGIQKRAAIMTTYIIKTPTILYTLLKECRALDIVMHTILTEGELLSNEASFGLTTLANNLKIGSNELTNNEDNEEDDDNKLLKYSINNKKKKREIYNSNVGDKRYNWGDELITFVLNNNKLKNGQNKECAEINNAIKTDTTEDKLKLDRIEFSKKLLTECSDVFNTMFSSNFKESKDNEVYIDEISKDGLNYFLYLIILKTQQNERQDKEKQQLIDINKSKENKSEKLKNIPLANNMDAALEAYELSIKYMLPDMEKSLFNVIKLMLNELNVITVYEWSLEHVNQELLDISINYFLHSHISGEKKVKLFRDVYKTKYSNEWKQLIYDTILIKCCPAGIIDL